MYQLLKISMMIIVKKDKKFFYMDRPLSMYISIIAIESKRKMDKFKSSVIYYNHEHEWFA